jgi:hypothetical protein
VLGTGIVARRFAGGNPRQGLVNVEMGNELYPQIPQMTQIKGLKSASFAESVDAICALP